MTDPDLTPEQETRVRALLQDARYDELVPDDVAARLDRVLAGLGVEPDADPDELAVRRRRRGAGLLAAAACLVVGGVAVGQVLSDSPGDEGGDTDSTNEISAESAEASAGAAASDGESALTAAESAPRIAAPLPITARPLEVSEDDFAKDAAAIGRRQSVELFSAYDADRGAAARQNKAPLSSAGWFTCAPAGWGEGDLVAVEYEGEPAVLAFRPPAGDTRVVEMLECGSAAVLRSVTLPRP